MLNINNISKTYTQNCVLDRVSFDIGFGCYGIIGNNGSGKSTLLNIISGDIEPNSGEIFYNNIKITRTSTLNRVLLGFGKMFQDGGFISDLTVFDNLKLTLLGHVTTWKELWKVGIMDSFDNSKNLRINTKIKEVLDKYQLSQHSLILAKDLSGGQKKLLQFARLELSESKVWLLDEPLAGVSLINIPIFEKIILEAKKTKTIILVEHNQNFVHKVADQVFEISDGKLQKIY
jgi:ABC-type branched-subunit amino acid transport system ATPase component